MSNSPSTAATTSLSGNDYFWVLLHNFDGPRGQHGHRFLGIFGNEDSDKVYMKEFLHWLCESNEKLIQAKQEIDSTIEECYLGEDERYQIKLVPDGKPAENTKQLAFEIRKGCGVQSGIAKRLKNEAPRPLYQCRSIIFRPHPTTIYPNSRQDREKWTGRSVLPGMKNFNHGEDIVTYRFAKNAMEYARSKIVNSLGNAGVSKVEAEYMHGGWIGIVLDGEHVKMMVVVNKWEWDDYVKEWRVGSMNGHEETDLDSCSESEETDSESSSEHEETDSQGDSGYEGTDSQSSSR
ncbi:uncharacterized protein J4E92_009699 [Alternaria infectoria]|uniref:uncharacterized protein n=1 Tax=Alternaria infectoria TaxID=45303 RepID=UPI002220D590|nr:uncharacterized protein J4E92_009699 [Alternaria infectoria]KAI4914285.1 hypothetical protein J4E92_009699 [Alternaria infectoria]